MNWGRLISCFVMIMSASLAMGQSPVVLPEAHPVTNPPSDCSEVPGHIFDQAAAPWVYTADASFLLWFIPSERASGIASLQGPAFLGVGGDAGEGRNSGSPLPGARFSLGVWSPEFDSILGPRVPLYRWGAEVSGFVLSERSAVFGSQVVIPGLGTTDVVGRATNNLWGLEANAHTNVYRQPLSQIFRADVFAGFRHLNFNSTLEATRRTTFADDVSNFPAFEPLAGTEVVQTAAFNAATQFYGFQVGVGTQLIVSSNLILGSEFKLALGANHHDLDISGSVRSTPTNPAVGTGPFPAASGSYSRNTFSYVPQISAYTALPIGENIVVRFGLDLLYWSDVARAADQVDLTTVGGGLASAEVIRSQGLFVIGFDVGLQFRY